MSVRVSGYFSTGRGREMSLLVLIVVVVAVVPIHAAVIPAVPNLTDGGRGGRRIVQTVVFQLLQNLQMASE